MADRQALGQFSSIGFGRRIVVPMSGLVIATVLLMPAFALVGAYRQSVIAVETSTQLTETALRSKQRVVAPGAGDAGTSIAMRSLGGERVPWTPEPPGDDLFGFHLPLMAGSLAAFAVFAFLVLRHVRRSATELETSARDRGLCPDARRKRGALPRRRGSVLGRSLDMILTAEAVETAEQAAFLSSEGCGQMQGYHFGRPLPAEDMSRLIEGWGGCKSATAAA